MTPRTRTPAPGGLPPVPRSDGIPGPSVRRADIEHLAPIIDLLADGIAGSPLGGWMIADTTIRVRVLRVLLPHALSCGRIDVIGDPIEAAAVWYHRSRTGLPPIPAAGRRLALAAGEHHDRIAAVLTARTTALPTGGGYDHLAFLAVWADRRRNGTASRLLTHHHQLLDATGISGYADVTEPATRRLLARHGYRPCRQPVRAGPATSWFRPLHRPPQPSWKDHSR